MDQVLDEGELVGGVEDPGRLGVPEEIGVPTHELMRQTLHRGHANAREGPFQPSEDGEFGLVPRPTRPGHQGHALRIGAAFDQPCEPLSQDHGLAGAGFAHDQEGTGIVIEDPLLRRVGLEGRVGHAAMLPPRADSPARSYGDPPPTGPRRPP